MSRPESRFLKINLIIFHVFLLPNLVGLKKFAMLLPNLPASRDPTDACFDAAWQTTGGKGADFCNHLNFSNKKTAGKLIHRVCLQSETTK
ncbi:hypothetical protein [Peribacillus frigoritolerans]|uniref:hypothetical protein n=1 Tax=Peribacillus frigoritolerans TaxID=450367 RepID=UPI00207B02DE|nr:hypothetical protein [Peribacillus frigoritolerans]USK75886.1 hypothetical protein LIT31_04770 [Peribacillus frigoritolerans]